MREREREKERERRKQKVRKTPLFDRVFKPKQIVLENGHTVDKPMSRAPFILAALLIAVIISVKMTGFDLSIIASRGHYLFDILRKIFNPTWSYFPKVIDPLIATVQMSLLGTIIGCLIGLPIAILASSNINSNRPTLLFFRFVLSIMRSVPTLILASVCALMFGLGTFAGTVAIVFFTIGIVAKMLFESIETIDMKPFEAMQSFGATTLQAFWAACMPQILPTYLSHSLYCFEMNVRAASILGYVGAGGLGILINERIGWRDYEGLGMVLLSLFVLVFVIDIFTNWCRSKLS